MKTLFIEYNQFDPLKIHHIKEYEYTKHNVNSKFGTPMYSYSEKYNAPLLFKTEFIDLSSDPFRFLTSNTKKYISLDPNNSSMSHLYKILYDISKYTSNYYTSNSAGLHESGPLLSNYNYDIKNKTDALDTSIKMKNLKLYFTESDGNITSTIYNYNKSKKYKPVEEYTRCTLSDIAKFISVGKQVRFILEPRIWKIGSNYGTKLFIKYMEVKYKDQSINSKFDEKQTIIFDKIISIEI